MPELMKKITEGEQWWLPGLTCNPGALITPEPHPQRNNSPLE